MAQKFYKAAIFDFDGVITDSEPLRLKTYETLFQQVFGVSLKVSVEDVIGYSQDENLRRFLARFDLKADIESLKEMRKKLLREAVAKGFPPVKAIHEILLALQSRNIPMVIASNSSREYLEGALKSFSYLKGVPVFSGDMVDRPKPDPEIFLKAVAYLKVAPEECLIFEDTPAGLEAARRAGVDAVGVLSRLDKKRLSGARYFLELENETCISQLINLFGCDD